MKKMLELKKIKKDYITSSETVNALKGVDITFRDKEFVSILGPSGCGKTTLLNIIGGLDRYTSGDLVISGKSTELYKDRDWDVYRNHRVGFIFQSYNLIPHQTVLGNVELALTIAGIGKEDRIERAKAALDKVGLSGQYYKRPNQLSGGQCQRVAIARALVNDPEILLADEPTGALDTVTSVQIMNLIRDIAGERLVIMVTHNPELAEQYSSRIIRLLDGEVVEDTNPVSEEEREELAAAEKASLEKNAEQEVFTDTKSPEAEPTAAEDKKKKPKKKGEKAKMSLFTAFRLSAKNLISKKGRTAMVGFAGSIGIIGIALVLAFSAGIKGYIASMQDDMLSGNPVEIAETGFNAGAVADIMTPSDVKDIEKLADKIYITSTLANLAEMSNRLERLFAANTITKEYIDYVKAMPSDNYEAMLIKYGIDLSSGVFTDFKFDSESSAEHISIKHLVDKYTSVLGETDYDKYSSFIPYLVPSLKQAPPNSDYILSQYDVLDGEIASEANEIMLVVNSDEEISDMLLAAFGYYTQEEFLAIIDKAIADDPENFNSKPVYREYFDYDELLGKEFVWYPADTLFTEYSGPAQFAMNGSYQYNAALDKADVEKNNGMKLKVVGILTPKDTVSYGCLTSGIYYTEALTEHILNTNSESVYINEYLMSDKAMTEIGSRPIQIPNPNDPANPTNYTLNFTTVYSYTYSYDDPTTPEDESKDENGNIIKKPAMGMLSPSSSSVSMSLMTGGSSGENDLSKIRDDLIRNLGGNSLANNILIYPKSFEEKDLVTEYLDKWDDESFIYEYVENGETKKLEHKDRVQVTYTDTLELVISMINTMIDIVSYALIAFTSVSLVVSTVMIGIITYVSVVERIKEIGVIRSLGGRKKDVSRLFIAETAIIGCLAGLIGVGATYLISFVVNMILKPLIGYASIAALPLSNAVLLVALSIGLTLISGLMPARSAANKDPVVALRTE